jgi:hypothetical protein
MILNNRNLKINFEIYGNSLGQLLTTLESHFISEIKDNDAWENEHHICAIPLQWQKISEQILNDLKKLELCISNTDSCKNLKLQSYASLSNSISSKNNNNNPLANLMKRSEREMLLLNDEAAFIEKATKETNMKERASTEKNYANKKQLSNPMAAMMKEKSKTNPAIGQMLKLKKTDSIKTMKNDSNEVPDKVTNGVSDKENHDEENHEDDHDDDHGDDYETFDEENHDEENHDENYDDHEVTDSKKPPRRDDDDADEDNEKNVKDDEVLYDLKSSCKKVKMLMKAHPEATENEIISYLHTNGYTEKQMEDMYENCDQQATTKRREEAFKPSGNVLPNVAPVINVNAAGLYNPCGTVRFVNFEGKNAFQFKLNEVGVRDVADIIPSADLKAAFSFQYDLSTNSYFVLMDCMHKAKPLCEELLDLNSCKTFNHNTVLEMKLKDGKAEVINVNINGRAFQLKSNGRRKMLIEKSC